jgi:hypothetical protein
MKMSLSAVKVLQRHHNHRSATYALHTGSRPSTSLLVFTEASDHGSRVPGESFARPQINNKLTIITESTPIVQAPHAIRLVVASGHSALGLAYRYQSRYHQP